jgi:hypothetical protein
MLKTEIRTVTEELVHVIAGVCDNCGTEMQPPYLGRHQHLFSGSLTVTLEGGYARFFDAGNVAVLLCRECARRLCEEFPCIEKAIMEAD